MPSYAALLREAAANVRHLCEASGTLQPACPACDAQAAGLERLADLLDRVTPEVVREASADLYDLRYSLPDVAYRNRELVAAVRALAAGPQPEEGRRG